jgi:hypothetical protein
MLKITWGLYYKISRIRNLREKDRFRKKLVSFDLDKYTKLGQSHELEQAKTLAFYGVRRLRIRHVLMIQASGVNDIKLFTSVIY